MVGLGTGYYYGAKAGRHRFEQLDRVLTKVRESEALDAATDKAKAVLDLGVERARDLIEPDDKVKADASDADPSVVEPGKMSIRGPARPGARESVAPKQLLT